MGDTRSNAAGSFENESEESELQLTVNTVEQAVFLERLPNPNYLQHGDIKPFGGDNLYPNKIKSMAQRSKSAFSAINTLTRFSTGQGFTDEKLNELIINSEKQTLFDILDHAANEKASIGVALHFNYNVFGEITEIQEMCFETLRWNKDMTKLVFCADWSREYSFNIFSYTKNDKIEYFPFDPENAVNEINSFEGGIEKYPGQVLYWMPKSKEIYPLARFDPVLEDVQFQYEAAVYKLKNIQNGYSANYIYFVPNQIASELEKAGITKEVKNSRGAKKAGKTRVIEMNNSAFTALGNRNLIEEIPRTGIDKLFTKQNEETKESIFAIYNQPMILNGISKDGMFNQESFVDAFDYYNSITEKDRKQLERIFNSFAPYTIWGLDKVEIKPFDFIREREGKEEIKEPKETIE